MTAADYIPAIRCDRSAPKFKFLNRSSRLHRCILGLLLLLLPPQVLADELSLTWRLAEGTSRKAGITCEGCYATEYSYAMVSCEAEGPDQSAKTTLLVLGQVCGGDLEYGPHVVVDGMAHPVRSEDLDDGEGVSISLVPRSRLWRSLQKAQSLAFGMKGKVVLDLTVPGLKDAFARVLAACGSESTLFPPVGHDTPPT